MVAEFVWNEAEHELRKRVAIMTMRGTLTIDVAERLLGAALNTASDRVDQIPDAIYRMHEQIAHARIPRDPDDWHTVALALASGAAIRTHDADFLGCGVATWTTETLLAHRASPELAQ